MEYPDLDKFVEACLRAGPMGHRSQIQDGHVTAYLRWTRRWLTVNHRSNQHCTIEIGSVEVPERLYRQGLFKAFLKRVEEVAQKHGRTVYIENVLSKPLEEYLDRQGRNGPAPGYVKIMNGEDLPCFFRAPDLSFEMPTESPEETKDWFKDLLPMDGEDL